MNETQYKATAGKTFLYLMIYRFVSGNVSNIIDLIVIPYIYDVLYSMFDDVDLVNAWLWCSFMICMILFATVIPLVRRLIIKMNPPGIFSANNALLYLSLTYLLGVIFIPIINPEYGLLDVVVNSLVFIYYLSLFFYFKHKSKTIEVINYDNKNV